MLSKIKAYLVLRDEMVSLTDLVNRFDIDHDRMLFMLSHWIRKGNIVRYQTKCKLSDGGCNGCTSAETDYFCWKKQRVMKIAAISLSAMSST